MRRGSGNGIATRLAYTSYSLSFSISANTIKISSRALRREMIIQFRRQNCPPDFPFSPPVPGASWRSLRALWIRSSFKAPRQTDMIDKIDRVIGPTTTRNYISATKPLYANIIMSYKEDLLLRRKTVCFLIFIPRPGPVGTWRFDKHRRLLRVYEYI